MGGVGPDETQEVKYDDDLLLQFLKLTLLHLLKVTTQRLEVNAVHGSIIAHSK